MTWLGRAIEGDGDSAGGECAGEGQGEGHGEAAHCLTVRHIRHFRNRRLTSCAFGGPRGRSPVREGDRDGSLD
ncbi:hypothetical protein GCM10022237_02370 [Nocardioides ginsengisoli]